jgi:hypothetical protein
VPKRIQKRLAPLPARESGAEQRILPILLEDFFGVARLRRATPPSGSPPDGGQSLQKELPHIKMKKGRTRGPFLDVTHLFLLS